MQSERTLRVIIGNMVGPDKQFDRNEVLNKALEVFWVNGYEATSMQELVDKMGINRASMYQTYGNKYALFNAALDKYITTSLAQLQQALAAPGPALDNLYNVFMHFIDPDRQGQKYGCFINNTAIEFGPHDPSIAEKVRNFWNKFEALLSHVLIKAIEQHELDESIDTTQMASLLNIALQGLVVKSKTNAPAQDLTEDTNLLFDLIRGSNFKSS